MATDNERMFREKLSILNEDFLRFLQKAHRSNSSLDFTPSIKDYLQHLRGLDQMYYVDKTTDAPAVTTAPLTAATTTAATKIPLLFGTNATPKTTTTPTIAVFPSFSTLSEGVPLTSTSSTVTTSASTTETSAAPKLIVEATTPVTTTSPSSTLTFGGFGATAPVTTTSPSSTLTFGGFGAIAPVTTTSPSSTLIFGGASTTTTTTVANIPLLFGTTATPKTTTTTTAAFPSFSTFSAGNFPISSITGNLFGSPTTQSVTSTSSGQLQVNGGSRKRSAAQSVDEISPYGKRAAPTLTTETSVIPKLPFGTTASMTTTSTSSTFTFGGASTTTTTTAANIPLLFGITATPKTTTTTTAAFPSFSTFGAGNFPTSSITGSLFGGSAINTATTTTVSLTSTSSTVTASTTETSAVPKPIVGATVPVTTTSSSSTFSFGGFGATAPVTTTNPSSTFTFGGFGATAPVTTTSPSSTFSFGGSPTTITTTAANFPLLFGTNATLKSTTTTTAAFPSFSTFGAGIFPTSSITGSLFGGSAINTTNSSSVVSPTEKEAPEKGNGSDDEPTEEFVPTDNFKPIVPLPPKVDTKSGEENEEMLFSARCKLFRYKDKQSKERGIGELKLLHSKESGRYRCVIRSDDQLSKLFANFPILANMKSQATQQKPNIRTLKCKDFSDNSAGVDEVFFLKFRDQPTAEEFAAKLEETAKKLEKSKGTD